jgi:hypothetical protein
MLPVTWESECRPLRRNKKYRHNKYKDGGRDRDRTCDPYHVKEARHPEIADFIGNSGMKNGAEGVMFFRCSRCQVQ